MLNYLLEWDIRTAEPDNRDILSSKPLSRSRTGQRSLDKLLTRAPL